MHSNMLLPDSVNKENKGRVMLPLTKGGEVEDHAQSVQCSECKKIMSLNMQNL